MKENCIKILSELTLNEKSEAATISDCCWALGNIILVEPLPETQAIKEAIWTICTVISLNKVKSNKTLDHILWAIA